MGFIQPKRIQVKLLKPDLALALTWWSVSFLSSKHTVVGNTTMDLQKFDDGWKIVASHTSTAEIIVWLSVAFIIAPLLLRACLVLLRPLGPTLVRLKRLLPPTGKGGNSPRVRIPNPECWKKRLRRLPLKKARKPSGCHEPTRTDLLRNRADHYFSLDWWNFKKDMICSGAVRTIFLQFTPGRR
jgi:hypothetical protein